VSVVANVAINVDSSGAVSKLRQVQTQATATQRAFGALQSAIAGIGVASIAAQTLKAAASFNDLQTRLKLLTSEYGEYTQAQQFAAKAAKQFGLSNREAATGVADIYGRLRPLGVSLKDIQSTFNGFNTIARLSGVSAEGASAAFLQLGQALGSGRLQGDEFRSIAEQVPGLLVAVSKETGIAAKDLKQFASDGKLSADIVINALKRIESEGAGKIAALVQNSDTQKFKDLQNAVDDLSVAVGNELLPVVTPLIKDLTSLVGTIAALPDPVKNATGEIIKLIIQLLLVEKAIKAIIGLNAAFVAAQVAMAGATATTGAAATTSAGAFALYTANARTLQATSIAATASVSGLAGALLGLAGIGIITVGINYVITQTGAILGSSTAAGKSEAAGTPTSLAQQLKGKTAAQRKQMLAAAQKNLANDKKLASALALQIQMQDNAALSSNERALPSDRAKLTELQARINTGQSRIKAIQTTPIQRVAATGNALPTPIGATVGGGGGGGGGGAKGKTDAERAADKAAREAERAAEAAAQEAARVKDVIRNRLAEGQIIAVKTQQQDRIAAAEAAGDKMLVARLRSQERELEIQYRYAQELAKEVNLDAQKAIIYEGLNALTANQVDLQRELDAIQTQSDQDRLTSLQKAIEKQYELNESVQNQLKLTDGIADTLGQGLGSAFSALISGAQGWEKSLQQIASGVLLDIANQLIRIFVIEQAINGIKTFLTPFSAATPLGAGGGMVGKFGTLGPNFGIPQRAKGGPVSSGQTYMVGERGPELFVPGRSGTIVANDKMGGGSTNVVVNVDAKGSSVAGDDQGASQLGRVISAAVQSELIKQQRPGGILAR
jgi:tape measure domain-containing protein